jgi:ribosomal protein L37AE/L43A
MSSVEAGMIGVWSCLYCEGAWLPSTKSSQVKTGHSSLADARASSSPTLEEQVDSMLCPECESTRFTVRRVEDKRLCECGGCGSTYLNKSAVLALASALGGRNWDLGKVFVQALSGSTAAKVDGAVTVAAMLYLLLS